MMGVEFNAKNALINALLVKPPLIIVSLAPKIEH
jgi:hypothetical protein